MSKQVFQHTLANGLKLVGEFSSTARSAAIGFFVKTGARDETRKEAGVSHFLEHMMFKGTPKRNALELTYELGNLAAQANAYTSEETTVYYAGVIPEYFDRMQELLSDMLRPSLDTHEFDTEKKVILEEIALYQDRPHFYLFEHAFEDFFAGHPAGNSVLGSTQSVGALARDEMKSYFDRRYAPNNMTLVASGNFDWESFRKNAEGYCGTWKPQETGRARPVLDFKPITKEYTKAGLQQSHVMLMAPSCSAQDDAARYPLALLALILGDGGGSKLYWELIDSGLAESASADLDERDGVGVFLMCASTDQENLKKVTDILRRVGKDALDFSDKELDQVKTKLKTKLVLSGESPMGRMMSLGTEWTHRGRIHSLQETMERVDRVTRQDIEKALARFPISQWSEFRLVAAKQLV